MRHSNFLICMFIITFVSVYIINNHEIEAREIEQIVPFKYDRSIILKQPKKYMGINIPTDNSIECIDLDVPDIDSSMKTYMNYKSITDTASRQWELQQSAVTNDEGFRMYNGLYMIALGTYYSSHVGIEFEIEFDTGKVIKCITGDIKDDKHTDKTNRYIEHNGNIVEFIIDIDSISSLSRKMGDMLYSDMKGKVVRITRILMDK